MEKDNHIEINIELLMEHAEKIIQNPMLGTVSVIKEVIEEIQIGGKIYELCLELKLKDNTCPSKDVIT